MGHSSWSILNFQCVTSAMSFKVTGDHGHLFDLFSQFNLISH